jgi:hypothetical protein
MFSRWHTEPTGPIYAPYGVLPPHNLADWAMQAKIDAVTGAPSYNKISPRRLTIGGKTKRRKTRKK